MFFGNNANMSNMTSIQIQKLIEIQKVINQYVEILNAKTIEIYNNYDALSQSSLLKNGIELSYYDQYIYEKFQVSLMLISLKEF